MFELKFNKDLLKRTYTGRWKCCQIGYEILQTQISSLHKYRAVTLHILFVRMGRVSLTFDTIEKTKHKRQSLLNSIKLDAFEQKYMYIRPIIRLVQNSLCRVSYLMLIIR